MKKRSKKLYSIEQIKIYLKCPQMYFYKYEFSPTKQIFKKVLESSVDVFSQQCLNMAIYDFFRQMQQGIIEDMDFLKKQFGKYYSNDRTVDLLIKNSIQTSSYSNYARKIENKCVQALRNFYYEFANEDRLPIVVNRKLGIEEIELNLNLPLVLSCQNEGIELVSFYPDHTVNNKKKITNDLRISVGDLEIIGAYVAFKELFKREPTICKTYALYSNVDEINNFKPNIERKFHEITSRTIKNIKDKVFYPIYTPDCEQCAYKTRCLIDWNDS